MNDFPEIQEDNDDKEQDMITMMKKHVHTYHVWRGKQRYLQIEEEFYYL